MISAGPCHAEALAAMHVACFPAPEGWPAPAFARLLSLPGHFAWLCEQGLAVARCIADEAELLSLGVLPEERRKGCGAALLAATMAEARRRGAAAIFLEVAAVNAAARRLYAANGFAEIGTRRAYYPDGGDALVLRAPLSATASPSAPSAS